MEDIPQGLEKFIARQSRKLHLAKTWAALAGLQPGMVIADIGCGTGILTQEYARMLGPDSVVYGVEQDAALAPGCAEVKDVRFLFQYYDSKLILEHIPDILFLTDTLHHLPEPLAVLHCLRQACGPRTRLFIAEYDPDQPGLLGAKLQRRISKPKLLAMLAAAGFRHEPIIDAEDEHYAVIARC